MIHQYRFQIQSDQRGLIPSSTAYPLYAWLLQQLPEEDASKLHSQEKKLFSQHLCFDKTRNETIWTLNLFHSKVFELLAPKLETLKEISLNHDTIKIERYSDLLISQPEDLLGQIRTIETDRKDSELQFISATSFKQRGRYVIFPQINLILNSLISKWNDYAPLFSLEDHDAMTMMLRGLNIVDYRLKTTRYPLKGTKIPGFLGVVRIESRLPAPLEEVWQLLLAFAPFSGIGMKTTLGMGGVIRCN